jgi:hypothetical protein
MSFTGAFLVLAGIVGPILPFPAHATRRMAVILTVGLQMPA